MSKSKLIHHYYLTPGIDREAHYNDAVKRLRLNPKMTCMWHEHRASDPCNKSCHVVAEF